MLKTGQVLNNRYQIQAVLGAGGFGAVYKVWDDNLQRYCAIKENLQVTLEAQKQFKREAVMLANLNHPHLVRVTDYFIFPEQGQYLVMDFVDGIDLHTTLINHGKALPLADTLKWTLQICDALIYIHSLNPPIIHRDIKPANIRITPQGVAVLVDFGLAKAFEANAKTSTGAVGWTPHFASPEQYGMGGTDAQSDIYSLGVTLYCMLTNHVPADSVDIMVGNAEPAAPARSINKDIPEFVSDALQHAMQIRRTDRYKSVGDFKNALVLRNKTSSQMRVLEKSASSNEGAHQNGYVSRGKIVSVFSGIAQNGISITTANLAAQVALAGHRVGVVDANLQSPGLHTFFGLDETQIRKTMNDFLHGEASLREVGLPIHEVVGGGPGISKLKSTLIWLFPSSIRGREISQILRAGVDFNKSNEGLQTIIADFRLDYLFVDMHAGVEENAILSLAVSDIVLNILSPDNKNLQNASVIIDIARSLDVPSILLMVNKALPKYDFAQIKEDIEAKFKVQVSGVLPFTFDLLDNNSNDLFSLRHPDHEWSVGLHGVAETILAIK